MPDTDSKKQQRLEKKTSGETSSKPTEMIEGKEMPPWPGVKRVTAKCVILYDNNGSYIIHGTSKDGTADLFKAVSSLWTFDPKSEAAQYFECEIEVPDLDYIQRPKVLPAGGTTQAFED